MIQEKLYEIITRISGAQKITNNSRIFHDLSIYGDDAFDVIEDIYKNFGTSFENFEFSYYFPNETEALLYHITKLLRPRSFRKREITVGHLLAVIEKGHWFEP